MKPEHAIVFICLFIVLFGLGKNLKSREKDKYIYRQMGETIAQIERTDQPIVIASLVDSSVIAKVHFYANLSYQGAICPRQSINFQTLCANNYQALFENLKKYNVQYFLWEKRKWPEKWFDFKTSFHQKDFLPIMRFQKNDKDCLILYKLISK